MIVLLILSLTFVTCIILKGFINIKELENVKNCYWWGEMKE